MFYVEKSTPPDEVDRHRAGIETVVQTRRCSDKDRSSGTISEAGPPDPCAICNEEFPWLLCNLLWFRFSRVGDNDLGGAGLFFIVKRLQVMKDRFEFELVDHFLTVRGHHRWIGFVLKRTRLAKGTLLHRLAN